MDSCGCLVSFLSKKCNVLIYSLYVEDGVLINCTGTINNRNVKVFRYKLLVVAYHTSYNTFPGRSVFMANTPIFLSTSIIIYNVRNTFPSHMSIHST